MLNPKPGRGSEKTLVFDDYIPEDEKRREALLSLGNGVILVRATAPTARTDAIHYPGSYLAGCSNVLRSCIRGETVEDESIVNLPNWLRIDVRPGDGEWLSLDDMQLLNYRQELDLDGGLMRRMALHRDREGRETLIREERLVSMAHPHMAALSYTILPQNWSGRLEVKTVLDGEVQNNLVERYGDYAKQHLTELTLSDEGDGVMLAECRTNQSDLHIAVGTHMRVHGNRLDIGGHSSSTAIEQRYALACDAGSPITIEKTAGLVFDARSGERASRSVRELLTKNLTYLTVRDQHTSAWQRLWQEMPLEAADERIARPLHFHMFHLLQNLSPNSIGRDLGFPARGWQEAYRGQTFWDELFAFPFYAHRFPEIARDLLMFRHRRLQAARENARERQIGGALYPWRSTRDGKEATPRYQKNMLNGQWIRDWTDLQVHVNGAIAYDILRYARITGDDSFLVSEGIEMLVEICRAWASLARWNRRTSRYDINGIVGPDEYHTAYPGADAPGLRNNAYTNVLATWCIRETLNLIGGLEDDRRTLLCLTAEELQHWDDVSRGLKIAFFGDGLIAQFEGVDELKSIALESLEDGRANWLLQARGDDVNAYQLFKQADFAMLTYLFESEELIGLFEHLGYSVTTDQISRSIHYYLDRTWHGSSLSEISFAGALARFDPHLSWACYSKSLRLELDPAYSQSSKEGVHLGAMAGTLDVLERHYLGLTVRHDHLQIQPSTPGELCPLQISIRCRHGRFTLDWRGTELWLAADDGNATSTQIRQWKREIPCPPGASVQLDVAQRC